MKQPAKNQLKVLQNFAPEGSGLLGYLNATYDELVRAFGKPKRLKNPNWVIMTPLGPVEIYTYKDG